MKKEDSTAVNIVLLITALLLLGYTLFSVIQQFGPFTGAAAQTATISFTLVSDVNATNVSAPVTGGNFAKAHGKGVDVSFTVTPQSYSFDVLEQERYEKSLRVKDTGDMTFPFTLLKNSPLVELSEESFTLSPGEERVLKVIFSPIRVGINTAFIAVKTPYSEKQVPIILNVQSPGALFTVSLSIPDFSKAIQPAGTISSTLSLGNMNRGFADVHYLILDAKNSIVYEERENIKVINEISVKRSMRVPSFLKPGSYVFGVMVQYKGETKSASQLFTILGPRAALLEPTLESPKPTSNGKGIFIVIFIICAALVHYYLAWKRKRSDL